MNQEYIETVKTAHNLCKEMKELYVDTHKPQSPEFLQKFADYTRFALDSDEKITPFLMKIALCNYALPFDIRVKEVDTEFSAFTDKFKDRIMNSHNDAELDNNSLLPIDLLYLRDVLPD